MYKGLIRLLAFFAKEINEVRRQPRLILSLVLGPFLILLLFGVGYRGGQPQIRAAFVIPDGLAAQIDVNSLLQTAGASFTVVSSSADEAAAMNLLQTGQVDLVEVIPPDIQARIQQGQFVPVQFRDAEINPINEAWFQYIGYAQVNEMNKALLLQTTSRLQAQAKSNSSWFTDASGALNSLSDSLTAADLTQRQASIRQLHGYVVMMAASPLLAGEIAGSDQDPAQVRDQLNSLADDLNTLDQSINNHTLSQQQAKIRQAQQQLAQFQSLVQTFSQISPQVIVSPMQPAYTNVAGGSLDLTTFYAPGVLALILQHIAVTLGALSLVRERTLGTIELFRVAPVSTRQIILGKYLAYTLFVGIIAAALILLMQAIHVPFRGSIPAFAGVTLLLILGALGIGLLVSIVSKSDSQAIQLSMLVLLFSIFFGGFFLPLSDFSLPVRVLGYALPLTSAIEGMQNILLRGIPPSLLTWAILGAITLFTFLLVIIFAGRQLRFSQG